MSARQWRHWNASTTWRLLIAQVDESRVQEAIGLLHTYMGHKLGVTDTVNAVLAWSIRRPAILSFDYHYREVIAPRHHGEKALEVWPDVYGQYGAAVA